MNAAPDLQFEEWVSEARRVSTLDAAYRLGWSPLNRRSRTEKVGACPACGTAGSLKPALADRFRIHVSGAMTGVFGCRFCKISGHNGIALVMATRAMKFAEACEFLTDKPPPRGIDRRSPEERTAARAALDREIEKAAADAEERRLAAEKNLRDRIEWASRLWATGSTIEGTLAEDYLSFRGLGLKGVNTAALGFRASLRLNNDDKKTLWTGPAMLAQVVDARGQMVAVHRTWIDPLLATADPAGKGRPLVVDPDTGEIINTKKTLGAKHGGAIRLVRGIEAGEPPLRLFIAEGIETLLSVYFALLDAGSALVSRAAFWCACDLGNIPSILIPACIREVVHLGDGDSARATVEHYFDAAVDATARPGLSFRRAFAREGADFNDMRRGRS